MTRYRGPSSSLPHRNTPSKKCRSLVFDRDVQVFDVGNALDLNPERDHDGHPDGDADADESLETLEDHASATTYPDSIQRPFRATRFYGISTDVMTADIGEETARQLAFELLDTGDVTPVADQRVLVHEPSGEAFTSMHQLAVFHRGWTAGRDAGGDEP